MRSLDRRGRKRLTQIRRRARKPARPLFDILVVLGVAGVMITATMLSPTFLPGHLSPQDIWASHDPGVDPEATPPPPVPAPVPIPIYPPRFTFFDISPQRVKGGQLIVARAQAQSSFDGKDVSDTIQWVFGDGSTVTGPEVSFHLEVSERPMLNDCNIVGPSVFRIYTQVGIIIPIPSGGAIGGGRTMMEPKTYIGQVQANNMNIPAIYPIKAIATDRGMTAEQSGSIELLPGKMQYRWYIDSHYFAGIPNYNEIVVSVTDARSAVASGSFMLRLTVAYEEQRVSSNKTISVYDGRDPNLPLR